MRLNPWEHRVEFSSVKGAIFTGISVENDEIKFTSSDGQEYVMYHEQDLIIGNAQPLTRLFKERAPTY